jgi:hypothetical protein
MRSRHHTVPRVGDHIIVQSRDDVGLRSDGKIILVDREAREALVEFSGHKIIREVNYFQFKGHWVSNCMYRIDGVLHHPNTFLDLSCALHPGGDIETVSLDHLNWSSSDGGDGAWFI